MTFLELKKEINQGVFKPIYLLMGEEAYFIDALTQLIEKKALNEEERSFNQTVLYGRETDVDTIIGEAKRYPMMAERVLVLVKEAQNLRNLAALEAYAENPQPSTVLVLAYKYKKVDKRTKLYKWINNQGGVFESKKLYDDKIPAWIEAYLKEMGYPSTPKALQLLTESLGSDLSRIVNELKKLALVIPPKTTITDDLVEEHIGISKDYNNFELQNAIGSMNFLRAMKIQKYFEANPKGHPLLLTLPVLHRYFRLVMMAHQSADKSKGGLASLLKVQPYFLDDYLQGVKNFSLKKCARVMSFIREADVRSKGINNGRTSDSDLLKELIYKIFYA